MGDYYKHGLGGEKDTKKAFKYYKASASTGNLEALNNLGECYFYKIDVTENVVHAYLSFKTAALQGYAEVQFNLGEMHDKDKVRLLIK